jgi:hypothetical protein
MNSDEKELEFSVLWLELSKIVIEQDTIIFSKNNF